MQARPLQANFYWGNRSLVKTFTKLLSWSASAALLIGSLAHADVVTDWNAAALNAIRAGHTAPPIASRSLAILHVSIYDAVNGIARTHEPYLVQSPVPASGTRWITTKSRHSARPLGRRARQNKQRSPYSGPTVPAPRRLQAIGTVLRKLSPMLGATRWNKTPGCSRC